MQLIVDTEPSIDKKRNMSTLNEESHAIKLDVIQDLKSGLCNGNKENIQSQENILTCGDESNLGNDKIEESSKSPIPDENVDTVSQSPKPDESVQTAGKSLTPDDSIETGKIITENNVVDCENIMTVEAKSEKKDTNAEDSSTENNSTEDILPKTNEGVDKHADNDEESDPIIINHGEDLNTNEQEENDKKYEKIEEMDQQVSEKVEERCEKVEILDENIGIVDEQVKRVDLEIEAIHEKGEKVDEKLEQDLDQNDQVDEESMNIEKDKHVSLNRPIDKDIDKNVDVDGTIENFDNKSELGDEKMEKVVDHISEESNQPRTTDAVTSNGKDQKIDEPEENLEDFVDQANKEGSVQNNSDLWTVQDVDKDLEDKNDIISTSCDTQATNEPVTVKSNTNTGTPDTEMINEPITVKSNTDTGTNDIETSKNHQAAEEMETVDLDDEEKENVNSEKSLDILSVDSKPNVQNAVENGTTNDKSEHSIIEMETVDLDDEKDVSGTEAMDVDINGETEETEPKDLPISLSSDNDDMLILDCENNRDKCVPTNESLLEKTNVESKNIVTPMDEDLKPTDDENPKKEVENLASEPINILDDEVKGQKKESEESNEIPKTISQQRKVVDELKSVPSVLKLSNTLDILSDDEDELTEPHKTSPKPHSKDEESATENKCINIEDDDDIMLIDEEDTNSKDCNNEQAKTEIESSETGAKIDKPNIDELNEKTLDVKSPETSENDEKTTELPKEESPVQPEEREKVEKMSEPKAETYKPLVPNNFLKTCKKNMAEMTRDDLEEFCVLKIVESVVDRSTLSEIKSKLKTMTQSIEEYKKKAMMLQKQNRDLQVVLKTIQEEQKNSKTVTPLKITRSVGMQVLMTERSSVRRKGAPGPAPNMSNTTPTKTPSPRVQNQRALKVTAAPSPPQQQIPVPRLVPASNSPAAKNNIPQINATASKAAASPMNGVRNPQKAEKRGINRNHSVTVDLTDDEPPTKMMNRNNTPTPLRVVPPHMVPQNLLAATPRHPIGQNNNPRKVYIPISGPQNQNMRPGQAIMLKSVSTPTQSPRPRGPQSHMTRMPQNQVRMPRVQNRHPAPLPESNKQYPGTYLKALPPAPDLKLSKVENGIVISWKIEGYQEDSYEEIASYQLYAYQETSSPPSTALWKKIGDVKALPLPMACTLTQFMAGFKYYFAVRAVDIRSRIGPFSLPGSILLLNKL